MPSLLPTMKSNSRDCKTHINNHTPMCDLSDQSGEEVRAGDRILYHGEQGRVEYVVLKNGGKNTWHVEHFPNDGMGIAAEGIGAVFIPAGFVEDDEDLEFVSRK